MSDIPETAQQPIATPFERPLYVMCKAAGPACNLACRYCYYSDKGRVVGGGEGVRPMSESTLELYIKRYIEAQPAGAPVLFTWHGGEPTLRGLDFYKRAVELQRTYGAGREIQNCLQTNGTLIDDKWARWLHDENWLVGLSIDGPSRLHDHYRVDHQGRPTSAIVLRTIKLFHKHRVQWNAMAVVNDANAAYGREFYRFFRSVGCRYIQFTPIVERFDSEGMVADPADEGRMAPFAVTPQMWGRFLCDVFDEWIKQDVGSTFVQIFDATLANRVGVTPGLCTLSDTCGHAAVMEHDGDVYSCDHFVFPKYRLGNIRQQTFIEMMMSERQREFGARKMGSLTAQCRACKWLSQCHGECPKNRISLSVDGEPGHNYLCEGYRMFFEHTEPYFEFMASELAVGRAPANVMKHLERLKQS